MVNGAPGSAWASERSVALDALPQRRMIGTLAVDDPRSVAEDSLFDLASLTKVFTTLCALRLVDAGAIDPAAPVSEVLPIGRGAWASRITLRHLLTHTSGLPAENTAWRTTSGAALLERVLESELQHAPGTTHRYSDVGFIGVGVLLEQVTGRSLDALVADVAMDLGADSLTYRPVVDRTAATETQPHRGAVRGVVHDELAHALGRPVGHAGLFGALADVVALARMVRDDGRGGVRRVLSAESAGAMTHPLVQADGYQQAVGLRVRDRAWMGEVDAVGHTGFTGTCFAVERERGGYAVLLTNRVHPTRVDADINAARRRLLAPLGGTSAHSVEPSSTSAETES